MAIINIDNLSKELLSDDEHHKSWHRTASECLIESLGYLNSDDYVTKTNWKKEAENVKTGDTVYSRKTDSGKLLCMIIEIEVNADDLIYDLTENIDREHEFNHNFESIQKVIRLGAQSDVTYAVLRDQWIISGREMTTARIWRKIDESWIIAGRSIECHIVPPKKDKVRAHLEFATVRFTPTIGKPNCCTMEYLTQGDIKGWFPKKLVDAVMGKFLLSDGEIQRQRAERLRQQRQNQTTKVAS